MTEFTFMFYLRLVLPIDFLKIMVFKILEPLFQNLDVLERDLKINFVSGNPYKRWSAI